MIKYTLEELLEVGAHFGHQSRRWNPKMESYLYGVKDGVHLFDLVKTKEALDIALTVLSKFAKEGKVILFVGTKKQAKGKLSELAQSLESPYIIERFMGGTLTNFDQIRRSVKKLDDMKKKLASGEYDSYTKKERLLISREIEKLQLHFGGIVNLDKLPDILVVVDTHKEKGAVAEASRLGIPTIGVVDSNSDPADVTYPIPMNDDGRAAVEFVIDLFGQAVNEGRKSATVKSVETKEKAKPKTAKKVTEKKIVSKKK